MTNKLSYMHKVSTGKARFLFPVIVPGWRADLHPVRRFVCFMVGL